MLHQQKTVTPQPCSIPPHQRNGMGLHKLVRTGFAEISYNQCLSRASSPFMLQAASLMANVTETLNLWHQPRRRPCLGEAVLDLKWLKTRMFFGGEIGEHLVTLATGPIALIKSDFRYIQDPCA